MAPDDDVPVRLARIETKIDALLQGRDDHESRIRKLERVVWLAAGVGLASGGAAGAAVTKLLGGV